VASVLFCFCFVLFLEWPPRLTANGFTLETDISTMIQSCNLGAKDSKRSPVHFFCIRLCING
uniref:Uncharacterized protein n=1 Tax=Felis catus TaxID=9685 RepID=A0ABI7WKC5_FELCA